MVSRGALLRNIKVSGGLFTENILLRLRDNPEQLKIGKIESFIEEDTKESKTKIKQKKEIIFDWCIQKWDEISTEIEDWSLEDLTNKWLIPLFMLFGHEVEVYEPTSENVDEDHILKDFRITHQSKDHKNPFFHFVSITEDFDSNINTNPQKKSHHNICQQFVNFTPEIRWLFLSNGQILRILTKYYHSYSKGYLEFDLENVFANRDLKEFNVLFSVIHSTRFAPEFEDHEFLIDLFQKESVTEGVKIGDALRDNVHDAIELLGDELIQQNKNFQEKISAEKIDTQKYYAELLRMIYRIIFILYAEQREMLPGAGSIYFEKFSLSSLRILAEKPIRLEKNFDLWNKLFLTFNLVDEGNDFLGVNSYNGSLFDNNNLSIIIKNNLKISNEIVLRIIRLLTTSTSINVKQRINFIEISEEEIGAIYESLLDFKPIFNSNLEFKLIEGTERKSTGSYYTPRALIDILIRTTLQQVVEDRLEQAGEDINSREKVILDLKVCDPACGGGTFLLAALDFLGKKLAEVKTGSDSPPENDLRESRREILQHCIYGVDMNPLAVELAKISLWLRASVKDKPLNFLDNHIKCGNSLVGLGKKMEIRGVKDDAFIAVSGQKETGIPSENKKLRNYAKDYIKLEKKERNEKGKPSLITSFFTEERTADVCSVKFQELVDFPENSVDNIRVKQKKYYELRMNENYQQALNEANIWLSTFFWPFDDGALNIIPSFTVIEQLRIKISNFNIKNLMVKINNLAKLYQFFHWYVEFPEVFYSIKNGFDCILTNPPWETLSLKESEFFQGTHPEILDAPNQSERRKLIKKLKKTDPNMYTKYKEKWIATKKLSHYLSTSGFYDLSAKGTINIYQLFVERSWNLINEYGYVGIICPTGIIMNYYLQDLFKYLVHNQSILSMFDFENRNKLFKIHSRFRFCLLTLGGKEISQETIPMTFYAVDPVKIQEALSLMFENEKDLKRIVEKMPDDHILILLEQSDFELFNPNTLTCPSFRRKKDADLLRHLYKEGAILIKRDEAGEIFSNSWKINFLRLFDMAGDSNLFITKQQLIELKGKPLNDKSEGRIWIDIDKNKYYPLYEGRMIWHYNHRLNSMDFAEEGKKRKAISIESPIEKLEDFNFSVIPNYWVDEKDLMERIPSNYNNEWFFAYRNITGATNERTFVATIIPKSAVGHSLNLIISKISPDLYSLLLANMNSLIFDYIVRLKIPGTNLGFFIVEQLPVIPIKRYSNKLREKITKMVNNLIFSSNDIKSFSIDINYNSDPFKWNIKERREIQAELDSIYAKLYRINEKDLHYILDSFTTLKRKEIEEHGEYLTKKLVIKSYHKILKQEELIN